MQLQKEELFQIFSSTYPFHLLSEEDQRSLFERTAVYQYAAGGWIYQKGQQSTHLYILAHGAVQVISTGRQNNKISESLVPVATIFGMEVVDTAQRWCSAKALEETVVLSLNSKQLQFVLKNYPELHDHFVNLLQAARTSEKKTLPWKEVDEHVYFFQTRHPITFLFSALIPTAVWLVTMMAALLILASTTVNNILGWALMGLITVVVLVWLVLLWIDWENDHSFVSNRRVVFSEKIILLYESRQEAPINAILSVGKDTSFLGRIFHYSNLMVKTYTGVIQLPALRDSDTVIELLTYLQLQSMSTIGRRERVTQMADALRNQLMGNKVEGIDARGTAADGKPLVRKELSNLLLMRFEQDGVVTFRTHWWILLRKLFFPTLVFIALQLLLLASWMEAITILPPLQMTAIIAMLDLAAILWWVYNLVDWANDYYQITSDQIIDVYKKPLGSEDKRSAPIKNIQSINFKRNGIAGVLFNFGTVYALIGDNQLTFDNVPNPSAVQQEMFKRLYLHEYQQQLREEKSEQFRIREWIEAYNQVLLEMEQTQPITETAGIQPDADFDEPAEESYGTWQPLNKPEGTNEGTIAPNDVERN